MRPVALAVLALFFLPSALIPAVAQDYRVDELQEQVRKLTGRVEELSFQLLQMEERLRKTQADNEFRFQELEDAAERKTGAPAPATGEPDAPERRADVEPQDQPHEPPLETPATRPVSNDRSAARVAKGAPPRPLGTLTFDAEGNLRGAKGPQGGPRIEEEPLPEVAARTPVTPDARPGDDAPVLDEAPLPQPGEAGSPFATASEATLAAARYGATPAEVFGAGKTLYESRDYAGAESAFRAHLAAWPKDRREADARHYLGQSLFWQKKYYDAASLLLDTHNAHPNARLAPDTLLALGLSLAGLDQREVACATYAEVLRQYPKAAKRLGPRVKAEQEAARC